jgi:hypothetical protein
LTLQRRVSEIGRIRLGTSEPFEKGGKTFKRPVKLETFLFTSRDRAALTAIAEQFGGEVGPWPQGGRLDIFQVAATAKEIDVVVPPRAVSQWMEAWDGGRCVRRCDGVTQQTGEQCVCPPKGGVCKPTTRISVILADVPGLGVWRLESHGWNAAAELGGMAEWLSNNFEAGRMIPAVLRAETRSKVTEHGTSVFVVPVLSSRATVRELVETPDRVMLPPAPSTARAITVGPRPPVDPDAPDPAPAHAGPPASAQEMADWVLACTDLAQLEGVGARHARGAGWMDDFVVSRYAPVEGELIELVEVFRARAAELRGVDR